MRLLRHLAAPVALLAAITLAGCGSASDDKPDAKASATKSAEPEHAIKVTFDEPADTADNGYVGQLAAQEGVSPEALAKEILKLGEVEGIADGFAKNFALPEDLTIRVASGDGSPFYDPATKTVTIFYSFANLTANIIQASNPKMTDEELGTQWAAVNDFVLIHELGHAFVDLFEIPIIGREEDAVDGLATYFFTDEVPGGQEYAFDAANFFSLLQDFQGDPDVTQFSDEHSLSVQRAFDIACKVAGSSEEAMQVFTSGDLAGVLPEARLARCPAEAEQNSRAWSTLLKPFLRSEQK